MLWFLDDKMSSRLINAYKNGVVLSEAQMVEAKTIVSKQPAIVQKDGVASIPIEGVLTDKADWFAAYFGGGNTIYGDIINGINAANNDSSIKSIELAVGYTPGGSVIGMVPAMDAIKNSKKPVTATVKNGALSAGYGLISQASQIKSSNRGTMFGSIGTAIDTYVSENEVSISSTNAPKKRPDLKTEEGKSIIREELDEHHEILASAIASGRKTTIKKVNKNFGQGAVVLAETALENGMIDSIGAVENNSKQIAAIAGGQKTEVKSMDLEKLKAEHPAVYAAAVEVGKEQGIKDERDRVNAHLKLGADSGDMATATKAIHDGSGLTQELTATYLAAGMRKKTADDTLEDNKNNENLEIPAVSDDDKKTAFEKQIVSAMDGGDKKDGRFVINV